MCTSLNVKNKIFEENNEMISDEWTSASRSRYWEEGGPGVPLDRHLEHQIP